MKRSAKKLLVLTVAFAMVFSAFSAYGFAVEGTTPQVTKADVKATSIKLTTQLVMQKEKPAIKLTWKQSEISMDYYQILRSEKKTFKTNAKPYIQVKGEKDSYTNSKNLKLGSKYYYKVRGVKMIGGEKVYTKWSNLAYRTAGYPVADSVWYNGNIYTVDDNFSKASALAVVGDKLMYVGKDGVAKKLIGKKTKVHNLKKKTVLPGLIESHMHAEGTGWMHVGLNVFWLPKETILQKVKEAAEKAKPGEWIRGTGWINTIWEGDNDFPTKEDLDAVAPNNPVYLSRACGHVCWVNSKAIELAGITNDTPNPQGGYIYRDKNGEATGIFTDTAMYPISGMIPPKTEEQVRKSYEECSKELVSYGFTSIMDAGTSPKNIELYKEMIQDGTWKVRVDAEVGVSSMKDDGMQYVLKNEPQLGLLNNMLDVMCIKTFADGSMGGRSAAMLKEYSDAPGRLGEYIYTDEELNELVKTAYDRGYQVSIHAIGDGANHQVINAYEAVIKANPRDHRLRIEHYQCVTPEDIKRTVELGILPCMQSIHATSDLLVAEERWGSERIKSSYAWRTILDLGGILPNGSDSQVELLNPYHGLYAAVTRTTRAGYPEGGWYPEQCMTREEAVRSFTIWGAYSMFGENIKGSLEAGKLADFVVIDRDVMTCPDWELMNIQALTTVLGGKVTYQRNSKTPMVSFQGVPVTFNQKPYLEEGVLYAPLKDMTNALSATVKGSGKNKAKITYKEKSITLPTVKKNGVEYVKVTSLYKGLGFKTQWQKLSKTMSIGA